MVCANTVHRVSLPRHSCCHDNMSDYLHGKGGCTIQNAGASNGRGSNKLGSNKLGNIFWTERIFSFGYSQQIFLQQTYLYEIDVPQCVYHNGCTIMVRRIRGQVRRTVPLATYPDFFFLLCLDCQADVIV